MLDVDPLRTVGGGRPGWQDWLARVPRLVEDLLGEWRLVVQGRAAYGSCAVVLPVRTVEGHRAALKVGWPHPESASEHLALRAWGGTAAVHLWRADPRRSALLLERADATRDLTCVPVVQACAIVGGLYPRLHRAPLPQTRRLSDLCRDWAAEVPGLTGTHLLPRRFLTQAAGLLADFADDPATDARLIHGDLHFGNVLAGDREPWLVIDPKPLSGDPCFEVAPLLTNRWAEVRQEVSARDALLERLETVVDAAGLDEDRVRAWAVVRQVVDVCTMWRDHRRWGAPLDADAITRATTVLKAVQPG